ncbi:anti-sigma factor domain-containing protein [Puniceibacterium sp. IMCC21224]|uniref:anti-sigma factor n=1 Tax=Puniceibacterium sp. IMCC21224 TaxID=1618204 RepID=UPI00064D7F2D|nr:anti-sigma factor [Puniceibacterium sp. IMCC21224]KMK67870.1 hypothetical protein IMCC21224_112747 [Puniceibacterium sp. IMCC21224]
MSERDDINGDLPGGDVSLCAEYVLGLLTDAEARAFETRFQGDPDLRDELAYWADHFAALTDAIPAEAPPAAILGRIENAAFGARPSLWRQLMPYIAGALVAASVAWVAMVSGVLNFGAEEPHLYASLEPVGSDFVLLAHYAPDSGTFMVRRDEGVYPSDAALEIWLIADADSAPVSLGLMVTDGLTQIPVSRDMATLFPGATIAVSQEPPGGSPTGAPTGPVVAVGQFPLDPIAG